MSERRAAAALSSPSVSESTPETEDECQPSTRRDLEFLNFSENDVNELDLGKLRLEEVQSHRKLNLKALQSKLKSLGGGVPSTKLDKNKSPAPDASSPSAHLPSTAFEHELSQQRTSEHASKMFASNFRKKSAGSSHGNRSASTTSSSGRSSNQHEDTGTGVAAHRDSSTNVTPDIETSQGRTSGSSPTNFGRTDVPHLDLKETILSPRAEYMTSSERETVDPKQRVTINAIPSPGTAFSPRGTFTST